MLTGIDVSSHQGEIDWNAVARAGYTFAWIKTTEGSSLVDPMFAANWAGAFMWVMRGAYHFLTGTSSPEAQADAFLRAYPGGGELPVALDIERSQNGSAPTQEAAIVWISIVEQETGARPIVYVSPGFADEHVFARHAFDTCELWVAHYGVKEPRIPRPWTYWRAWQRGAGLVPGVRGRVDIDVMREP